MATKKNAGERVVKVSADVWGYGQTIGLCAVVRIPGMNGLVDRFPTSLQIVISADRAHAYQGHGAVSLWTSSGWRQIHNVAGALLTASSSAYGTPAEVGHFEDDVRELLRVAFAVLGFRAEPSTKWMFPPEPKS